jgi:hypothetical protein
MEENINDAALGGVNANCERIGEGLFAGLAQKRNAAPLIGRLEAVGIGYERVEELAGMGRRASSLIYQRPNAAGPCVARRVARRAAGGGRRIAPEVGSAPLERAIRTGRIADRGHHIILSMLGRTDISKEPQAVRAADAIARVEANLTRLREKLDEVRRKGGVAIPGGVMLEDEHGRPLGVPRRCAHRVRRVALRHSHDGGLRLRVVRKGRSNGTALPATGWRS